MSATEVADEAVEGDTAVSTAASSSSSDVAPRAASSSSGDGGGGASNKKGSSSKGNDNSGVGRKAMDYVRDKIMKVWSELSICYYYYLNHRT